MTTDSGRRILLGITGSVVAVHAPAMVLVLRRIRNDQLRRKRAAGWVGGSRSP